MVKVLHIVQTLNACGGIENLIMNYYRHIDKNKIQFDFLIHELNKENFKEEVESLGGTVYLLPPFTIWNLKYILYYLSKFYLLHKEYDVIHCHMANAAPFHFYFVKKNNNAIRVLHSHQPAGADKITHRIRNTVLLKMADAMADIRLASSSESGRFLFGKKKFTVVKNAVDKDSLHDVYIYRHEFRRQYNIENKMVIGHIGRFAPVKNHKFLLEILKRLCAIKNNAVLCLVGEGERKKDIIDRVKDSGLEDRVIFIDSSKNIEKYYSMFDIFLLPSLFEGFGLVAVEAQYAGVPVVVSENRVPKEVAISNYIHYLPLEYGSEYWARKILEICSYKCSLAIYNDDYDIKKQAKVLENIYLEMAGEYGET